MTVWLFIFLGLSVALNVLFFWYIKKMLNKLLFASENIGNLKDIMENFASHLDDIHELEMFYGDETLESLIKHSKEIVENIKEFEEIYSLTDEDLLEEGYLRDEEE